MDNREGARMSDEMLEGGQFRPQATQIEHDFEPGNNDPFRKCRRPACNKAYVYTRSCLQHQYCKG